MAECSHLAPNGEKSLLYQQLEQKYGADKAHDAWEMVRSQQFLNKHGDWLNPGDRKIRADINGEPLMPWVEQVLGLSTFTPANEEQKVAIQKGQDFIRNGNPNEIFTLEGKAGTGKTTIAQEILAPFVKDNTIIVAALAHKAKLVLENKLKNRFGRSGIQGHSIAGMLGMGMDLETGKFSPEFGGEQAPIEEAGIIVVDEASMVNEEALQLIMEKKRPDAKVIFLGDIGQLPPIREKATGANAEAPSPAFKAPNKARLLERVRQGEESPILPYADKFWNNSQTGSPVPNPAEDRHSIITSKGSIVFSKGAPAIEAAMPLFKEAVESGNPDLVKIVVYRNNTRSELNNRVRKAVFGEKAQNQFVKGDLLMFQDNYTIGKKKISNSTEIQVGSAEQLTTNDGWKIWELGAVVEDAPMQIQVLTAEDKPRFDQYLENLANEAKKMPKGFERTAKWRKFYSEKGRFAPLDYSYAITSHKAQGSTYDAVLVGEGP